MRPITNLKILETIYHSYIDEFLKYKLDKLNRSSVIYVPIDVENIANQLKADPQLLFGRLYYDLDKQYNYTQDDGSKVHLFAFKVGEDLHAVNFPLLEGIIAHLSERKFQFWLPITLSIIALILSVYGIVK